MDGRVIVKTSYYFRSEPYLGLPNPATGEIVVIPNATLIWGAYWSETQAFPDQDAFFPLLDLIAQHHSYPSLVNTMRGIELDLGNMAAVLEKFLAISEYHESRKQADTAVRLMYLTELEYFFGVCRSLIDLLHECFATLHQRNGGRQLPATFGSFVDKSIEDMVAKYRLPLEFENYLVSVMPLFRQIRKVRDSIYHNGKSLEMIFLTDLGPGICTLYEPFDEFHSILNAEAYYSDTMAANNIGSLYYLVLKITDELLETTDKLASVIGKVFPKPDRYTKEGYNYYLRGPSFSLFNHRKILMKACWLHTIKPIASPHLDCPPSLRGPSNRSS
jgi:hypothetical protein